jgi:ABC-type glycerol-3-phosphate transport system substrate-binding protein
MFKIIVISSGVIAAVFAVLIFSGKISIGSKSTAPVGEVYVWGTFPQNDTEQFFSQYNTQSKTYHVTYKYIKEESFSSALAEAISLGNGPDAILVPYQKILEQEPKLMPFPITSFSEKDYKSSYVDGTSILWSNNGALALPVAIEPMVMFFNRTLLSKHGIPLPPVYWTDITDQAQKLTINATQGGFIESAIALGSYTNVPYVKDILMAIVNQVGQSGVSKSVDTNTSSGFSYLVTANTPIVENGDVFPLAAAFRFFMDFADPSRTTYTWNQFQPSAQDQFVAEKLALYIGYLGDGKIIHERNQKADVDIAFLPQTKGYNTSVTGMRLYGYATLNSAKNKTASLATEASLASSGWGPTFAAIVGAIPAYRSFLVPANVSDTIIQSTLVARGWYDIKPDQSGPIFARMVADVASGRVDITEAVTSFVSRFQTLYTGY